MTVPQSSGSNPLLDGVSMKVTHRQEFASIVQRNQQLSSYIMNGAVIGFRSGYYSNREPVKIVQMSPTSCLRRRATAPSALSKHAA